MGDLMRRSVDFWTEMSYCKLIMHKILVAVLAFGCGGSVTTRTEGPNVTVVIYQEDNDPGCTATERYENGILTSRTVDCEPTQPATPATSPSCPPHGHGRARGPHGK